MGKDWEQHLSLDLTPALVTTDRSVILGPVLTGLLINSNKYAYSGAAGPIEIRLIEDRTHLHLIVADKGQLGGELTYGDAYPGLRTAVKIPILPT